jgi:uncharacterized membrane protein
VGSNLEQNDPSPTAGFEKRVDVARASPFANAWYKPALILFLIVFAVTWVMMLLGIRMPETANWQAGGFLLVTSATTLVAVARRLPAQNVLSAALLIVALATLFEFVGVLTDVPFGPRLYMKRFGEKVLNVLPWPVPLVWLVALLNARGVARLIMRPWRKTTYYGFWVIGLACGLVVMLDLSFEPFATLSQGYWFWRAPQTALRWYTAPWVKFLGSFLVALAILAFTTPWLLNKQPVKQPIDYHPLVIWLLLNVLFATDALLHQRWVAFGVGLAGSGVVALFTIRGARW